MSFARLTGQSGNLCVIDVAGALPRVRRLLDRPVKRDDDSGIICAAAVSDGAMRLRLLIACYAPLPSRILDRFARIHSGVGIKDLFTKPAKTRLLIIFMVKK
jgi:hypothetical protein